MTMNSWLGLFKYLIVTFLCPFSIVESCSMETLRNAMRKFIDMELVTTKDRTLLHVKDPSKLLSIADSIEQYRK